MAAPRCEGRHFLHAIEELQWTRLKIGERVNRAAVFDEPGYRPAKYASIIAMKPIPVIASVTKSQKSKPLKGVIRNPNMAASQSGATHNRILTAAA